jgi:hypothetical protein
LEAVKLESYEPTLSHYSVDLDHLIIMLIDDLEPPMRDGGKIWFRNKETVIQMLSGMYDGSKLPPIEVWSKEKKSSSRHIIRDGFHRFYLSVGYSEIPVVINDFDLNEFLENEAL